VPRKNSTQVTAICAIKRKNEWKVNVKMDDKIYKITLADGTVIDNLKLNGNNFISPVEIDETIFDGNCLNVTINDGEKDDVHTNMELVQITKMGEEYWFILRDVPENELAFIKLQSDIEYIAMMSEIEL
jgi:hypothetical protein